MHALKQDLQNIHPLRDRADFLRIQKNGTKCVSHGLILQAMPNDLDHIRVGFTVTKKTEMSAVRRNRIKRRLRAAAADVLSQHAKQNADYVLIGRQQSAARPYETLCNDLKWCLGKLGYAR
ncbi:MAG: ribonuclease P protein component [Alphaproteobacteria bacterium]|nr:ribonuclease P protein component [Alphaproteobacteria bacterium]